MRIRPLVIAVLWLTLLGAAECQGTGTGGGIKAPAANRNGGDGHVVDVNLSREDFEKQRDRFEREAREAGRKVGPAADDLWIWMKTRAALAATDEPRSTKIDVDVENNAVTLTRSVGTEEQRKKAEIRTRRMAST